MQGDNTRSPSSDDWLSSKQISSRIERRKNKQILLQQERVMPRSCVKCGHGKGPQD
jgi:hypothetical protein